MKVRLSGPGTSLGGTEVPLFHSGLRLRVSDRPALLLWRLFCDVLPPEYKARRLRSVAQQSSNEKLREGIFLHLSWKLPEISVLDGK